MKKLNIKGLLILTGMLCFGMSALRAQSVRETTRSELPAFSRIVLGGDFNMEIRYGKQYQARLGVEELFAEYVRFRVEDSTLTVFMDERRVPVEIKRLFRGKDSASPSFRLVVTMPETLRSLELTDRAVLLEADDLVVASSSALELRATDNARIAGFAPGASRIRIDLDKRAAADLHANCDSLRVRLAGNASLTLEQHVLVSDIEISGGAELVLTGEAQRMDVQAKGFSKSILNGTAADVRYRLSGSTNVNAVNLETRIARSEQNGLCTLTQSASGDLYVDLAAGSTLVYLNDPAIHVLGVKNATLIPYDRK